MVPIVDFDKIYTPRTGEGEIKKEKTRNDFSDRTLDDFLGENKGKNLKFRTLKSIIGRFGPLVTFEEIILEASPKLVFDVNDTIKSAQLDNAVEAVFMEADEDRPLASAGPVVEIRRLGTDDLYAGALSRVGISPEEVTIRHLGKTFDKYNQQCIDTKRLAILADSTEENGEKLALTKVLPNDLSDAGRRVELSLETTDYFNISVALSKIGNKE